MHNGYIADFGRVRRTLLGRLSDSSFETIRGTTDTEVLFALFLDHYTPTTDGDRVGDMGRAIEATLASIVEIGREAGIEAPHQLNLAVTDGRSLVASRFTTGPLEAANSLYIHTGKRYVCEGGICRMLELLNDSERTLILNGLLITSSVDSDSHRIQAEELLTVEPGELIILGISDDTENNGGVDVDYVYTDVILSNESDDLILMMDVLVIDDLAWDDGDTMPDQSGASMSMDPYYIYEEDTDDPSLWCAASTAWGDRSDLGTPGQDNDTCPSFDHDDDGYSGEDGDCDDLDPDINPGAEETWYDGVDQDCDGADDYDQDGDGFLSDDYSGTDCDDEESEVNPDAEEVCDGLDNDCDGTVDGPAPLDPITWYLDSDGDSYGDSSASVESCTPPSGYVSNDEDCDDSDDTVNPDGTEVCDDGLDNDCDGYESSCSSTCGDSVLDPDEEYEPPPGPFSTATVDSTTCRWDFSSVNQLYCNGSCTWAGGTGCDQLDADILCQLITDNAASTATSWTHTIALNEAGFPCTPLGYGTVIDTDRGVTVNVSYQDTSILSNHGAGDVIAYPVCTGP